MPSSTQRWSQNMKPQTLLQATKEIIELGSNRNPTYKKLTITQREQLAATAMRDAGKLAYEFITEAGLLEALAGTLINTLEAKDAGHRKELLIKLGEMLIDSATEYAQKPIDDALDNAITELAVMRQFYNECGEYDYKNNCDPMRAAIYNHPEL
jgi:hypothetical protein